MSTPQHRFRAALADFCEEHMRKKDWRACVEALRGCALVGKDFSAVPYDRLIPFLVKAGQWPVLGELQMALIPAPYRPPDSVHGQSSPYSGTTPLPLSEAVKARPDSSTARPLSDLFSILALQPATDGEAPRERGALELQGCTTETTTTTPGGDLGDYAGFFDSGERRGRRRVGRKTLGNTHVKQQGSSDSESFSKEAAAALFSTLLVAAVSEVHAIDASDNSEGGEATIQGPRQESVVRLVRLASTHHLEITEDARRQVLTALETWTGARGGGPTEGMNELIAVRDLLLAGQPIEPQAAAVTVGPGEDGDIVRAALADETASDSAKLAQLVEDLMGHTERLFSRGTVLVAGKGTASYAAYDRSVRRLETQLLKELQSAEGTARVSVFLQEHATSSVAAIAKQRGRLLVIELALRLSLSEMLDSAAAAADEMGHYHQHNDHLNLCQAYSDVIEVIYKLEAPARAGVAKSKKNGSVSPCVLLPVSIGAATPGPIGVSLLSGAAFAVAALTSFANSIPTDNDDLMMVEGKSAFGQLRHTTATFLRWCPCSTRSCEPLDEETRDLVERSAWALAKLLDAAPWLISSHALRIGEGAGGGDATKATPTDPHRRFVLHVLDRLQRPELVAEALAKAEESSRAALSTLPEGRQQQRGGGRGRRRRSPPVRLATERSNKEQDASPAAVGLARLYLYVAPALRAEQQLGGRTSEANNVVSNRKETRQHPEEDDFDLTGFAEQLLSEMALTAETLSKDAKELTVPGSAASHKDPGAFLRRAFLHASSREAHVAEFLNAIPATNATTAITSEERAETLLLTVLSIPDVAIQIAKHFVNEASAKENTSLRNIAPQLHALACVVRAPGLPLREKAEMVTQFFSAVDMSSWTAQERADVVRRLYMLAPDTFSELHGLAMTLEGSATAVDGRVATTTVEEETAASQKRNRKNLAMRDFADSSSPVDRLVSVLVGAHKPDAAVLPPLWSSALWLLRDVAARNGEDTSGRLLESAVGDTRQPASAMTARVAGNRDALVYNADSATGYPLSPRESEELRTHLTNLSRSRFPDATTGKESPPTASAKGGRGRRAVQPVKLAVGHFYQLERSNKRLTIDELELFTWAVKRGPVPFARRVLEYTGGHESKPLALAAIDCAISGFYRGLAELRQQQEPSRDVNAPPRKTQPGRGQKQTQRLEEQRSFTEERELLLHQCEEVIVAALRALPKGGGDSHSVLSSARDVAKEGGATAFDAAKRTPMTIEGIKRVAEKVQRLYAYPPTLDSSSAIPASPRSTQPPWQSRTEEASVRRVLTNGGLFQCLLFRRELASLQHTVEVCSMTGDAESALAAYDAFASKWGDVTTNITVPEDVVLSLIALEAKSIAESVEAKDSQPPPTDDAVEERPPEPSIITADTDHTEAVETSWSVVRKGGRKRSTGTDEAAPAFHAAEQGHPHDRLLSLVEAGFRGTADAPAFAEEVLTRVFALRPTATDVSRSRGTDVLHSVPEYNLDEGGLGAPGIPGDRAPCIEAVLQRCIHHLLRGTRLEAGTNATRPQPRNVVLLVGVLRTLLVKGAISAQCAARLATAVTKATPWRTFAAVDSVPLNHWLRVLRLCGSDPFAGSSRHVDGAGAEGWGDASPSSVLLRDTQPARFARLCKFLIRTSRTFPRSEPSHLFPLSEALSTVGFLTRWLGRHPPETDGHIAPVALYTAAIVAVSTILSDANSPLFPICFAPNNLDALRGFPPAVISSDQAQQIEVLRQFTVMSSLFHAFLVSHRTFSFCMVPLAVDSTPHASSSATAEARLKECLFRVNRHYLSHLQHVEDVLSTGGMSALLRGGPGAATADETLLLKILAGVLQWTHYGLTSFSFGTRLLNATPTAVAVRGSLIHIARHMEQMFVASETKYPAGYLTARLLSLAHGERSSGNGGSNAEEVRRRAESLRADIEQHGLQLQGDAAHLADALLPVWIYAFSSMPKSTDIMREAVQFLSLLLPPTNDADADGESADFSSTLLGGDDAMDEEMLSHWRDHVGTGGGPGAGRIMDEEANGGTAATSSPILSLRVIASAVMHATDGGGAGDAVVKQLIKTGMLASNSIAERVCVPMLQHAATLMDDTQGGSLLPTYTVMPQLSTAVQDIAVALFLSSFVRASQHREDGKDKTNTSSSATEGQLAHMLEELSLCAPERWRLPLSVVRSTLVGNELLTSPGGDQSREVVQLLARRYDLALNYFHSWPTPLRAELLRFTTLSRKSDWEAEGAARLNAVATLTSAVTTSTKRFARCVEGAGGGVDKAAALAALQCLWEPDTVQAAHTERGAIKALDADTTVHARDTAQPLLLFPESLFAVFPFAAALSSMEGASVPELQSKHLIDLVHLADTSPAASEARAAVPFYPAPEGASSGSGLTAVQYVSAYTLRRRKPSAAARAHEVVLWEVASATTLSALASSLAAWHRRVNSTTAKSAATTRNGDRLVPFSFFRTLWTTVAVRALELEQHMSFTSVRHGGSAGIPVQSRAVYVAFLRSITATPLRDPGSLEWETLVAEVAAFALSTLPLCDSAVDTSGNAMASVESALEEIFRGADGSASMTAKGGVVMRALTSTHGGALLRAAWEGLHASEKQTVAVARETCHHFVYSPWPPAVLEEPFLRVFAADGATHCDARHPSTYAKWIAGRKEAGEFKVAAQVARRFLLLDGRDDLVRGEARTSAVTTAVGGAVVVNALMRLLYGAESQWRGHPSYITALRIFVDDIVFPSRADGRETPSLRRGAYLPSGGTWHMLAALLVERTLTRRPTTVVTEYVTAVQDAHRSILEMDEWVRSRMPPVNASATATRVDTYSVPQLFTKRDRQSILTLLLRGVSHARTISSPLGWNASRQAAAGRCWRALLSVLVDMSEGSRYTQVPHDAQDEMNLWSPELYEAVVSTVTFASVKPDLLERGSRGLLDRLIAQSDDADRPRRRPSNDSVDAAEASATSLAPLTEKGSRQGGGRRLTSRQLLRFFLGAWRLSGNKKNREAMDMELMHVLQKGSTARNSFSEIERRAVDRGVIPSHRGWMRALQRTNVTNHSAVHAALQAFLLFAPYMPPSVTAVWDRVALLLWHAVTTPQASRGKDLPRLIRRVAGALVREGQVADLGPVGTASVAALYSALQYQHKLLEDSKEIKELLLWRFVQSVSRQSESQFSLTVCAMGELAQSQKKGNFSTWVQTAVEGCVQFVVRDDHHAISHDVHFLTAGERLCSLGLGETAFSATFLDHVMDAIIGVAQTAKKGGKPGSHLPRTRALHLFRVWREGRAGAQKEEASSSSVDIAHCVKEVVAIEALTSLYGSSKDNDTPSFLPVSPQKKKPSQPFLWQQALDALLRLRASCSVTDLAAVAPQEQVAVVHQAAERSLRNLCSVVRREGQWAAALALVEVLQDFDMQERQETDLGELHPAPPFYYTALQYIQGSCNVGTIPIPVVLSLLSQLEQLEKRPTSDYTNHSLGDFSVGSTEEPMECRSLGDQQRINRLRALRQFGASVAKHPQLDLDMSVNMCNMLRSLHNSLGRGVAATAAPNCWQEFAVGRVTSLYYLGEYKNLLRFCVSTGFSGQSDGRGGALPTQRMVREAAATVAPLRVSEVLQLLRHEDPNDLSAALSPDIAAEKCALLQSMFDSRPGNGVVGSPKSKQQQGRSEALEEVVEMMREEQTERAAGIVLEHPFFLYERGAEDGRRRGGGRFEATLRSMLHRQRAGAVADLAFRLVDAPSNIRWERVSSDVLELLTRGVVEASRARWHGDERQSITCIVALSSELLRRVCACVSEDTTPEGPCNNLSNELKTLALAWRWLSLARPIASSGDGARPVGLASIFVSHHLDSSAACRVPRASGISIEGALQPLVEIVHASFIPCVQRDQQSPPEVLSAHLATVWVPLLCILSASAEGRRATYLVPIADALLASAHPSSMINAELRLVRDLSECLESTAAAVQHSGNRDLSEILRSPQQETTTQASLSPDLITMVTVWRDGHLSSGVRSDQPSSNTLRALAAFVMAGQHLPHPFVGFTLTRVRQLLSAARATGSPTLLVSLTRSLLLVIRNDARTGLLPFSTGETTRACAFPELQAALSHVVENGTAEDALMVAQEINKIVEESIIFYQDKPRTAAELLQVLSLLSATPSMTWFADRDAKQPMSFDSFGTTAQRLVRDCAGVVIQDEDLVRTLSEVTRRSLAILRPLTDMDESSCVLEQRQITDFLRKSWEDPVELLVRRSSSTFHFPSATTVEMYSQLCDQLVALASLRCTSESAVRNVERILDRLRARTPIQLSSSTRSMIKALCIDAYGTGWSSPYRRLTSYKPPVLAAGVGGMTSPSSTDLPPSESERLMRVLALTSSFEKAWALVGNVKSAHPNARVPFRAYEAVFALLVTPQQGTDPSGGYATAAALEASWRAFETWFVTLLSDGHTPSTRMIEQATVWLLEDHPSPSPEDTGSAAIKSARWELGVRFAKLLTILPPIVNARHQGDRELRGTSSSTEQHSQPGPQSLSGGAAASEKRYALSPGAANRLFASVIAGGMGVGEAAHEARVALGDFVAWYASWSRPAPLSRDAMDECIGLLCRRSAVSNDRDRGVTLSQRLLGTLVGEEDAPTAAPAALTREAFVERQAQARKLLPDAATVQSVLRLVAKQHRLHGTRLPTTVSRLCELFGAVAATALPPTAYKDSPDFALMARIARDAGSVTPHQRSQLALSVAEQLLWHGPRPLADPTSPASSPYFVSTIARATVLTDTLFGTCETYYVDVLRSFTPEDSAATCDVVFPRGAEDSVAVEQSSSAEEAEEGLAILSRVLRESRADPPFVDLTLPYRVLMLRWTHHSSRDNISGGAEVADAPSPSKSAEEMMRHLPELIEWLQGGLVADFVSAAAQHGVPPPAAGDVATTVDIEGKGAPPAHLISRHAAADVFLVARITKRVAAAEQQCPAEVRLRHRRQREQLLRLTSAVLATQQGAAGAEGPSAAGGASMDAAGYLAAAHLGRGSHDIQS